MMSYSARPWMSFTLMPITYPRKASFAFFSHPFTFLQTKFKTVNHLFQNHDMDQTLVIMQFFKENVFLSYNVVSR